MVVYKGYELEPVTRLFFRDPIKSNVSGNRAFSQYGGEGGQLNPLIIHFENQFISVKDPTYFSVRKSIRGHDVEAGFRNYIHIAERIAHERGVSILYFKVYLSIDMKRAQG